MPDFKRAESLASLGDHLCDIGSCENIRNALKTIKDNDSDAVKESDDYKSISSDYGLNREAFSIWKEYYTNYDSKEMCNILYMVERVYKHNLWVGADYGQRNLDHGVCSGLIALQALTFFRDIYLGLLAESDFDSFNKKQKRNSKRLLSGNTNLISEKMYERIRNKIIKAPKRITIRGDFDANAWFKKVCWATSSAAIHALIQDEDYKKECEKHTKDETRLKIALNDDPLAFLGVLVDSLQEWDRYKVKQRGESAFSGSDLLQSVEVKLKYDSHLKLIVIEYPEHSFNGIQKLITNCLENADYNEHKIFIRIKGIIEIKITTRKA